MVLKQLEDFTPILEESLRGMKLKIPMELSEKRSELLIDCLKKHPGQVQLKVEIHHPNKKLKLPIFLEYRVAVHAELLTELQDFIDRDGMILDWEVSQSSK